MIGILKNQRGMNIVGQGGKIILFMLPALIAAVWAHAALPQAAALPGGLRFLQPAGYVLLLPGLALWAGAMVQLLTGFPKGKLVTTGAYGIVRNPIYCSVMLFILPAVALLTLTWVYLVPAIFLCLGVLIFIEAEEKQLMSVFGKKYQDYTERVDRLVPFLKPRSQRRAQA